ncbi:hypothetical protein [Luethyella okanaganae]|uniref:Uncharacterized protein n=1 Tax=Luethyella okanaganae TaxID=69372 RepID=A0ABW1VJE1_9MICO
MRCHRSWKTSRDTGGRRRLAPLLLFAVIAVAAAVVAIAIMGLAAAWLMYCTANWPGSWPAVGVPTEKNGFYYFGCVVPQ